MKLKWKENLTPISTEFDDIYYAEESGLDEARYTYLGMNNLPEAWAQNEEWKICELGFGTGLNFFASLQSFLLHTPAQSSLHFYSCEKYPLSKDDLKKALSAWPELNKHLSIFSDKYQPTKQGMQKFLFENGRVHLNLYLGDVDDLLSELDSKIDCWFLDGFAPRKNPEMWSDKVLESVYKHSKSGSSFSTFTSAGFVKRKLQSLGFEVKKEKGFGRKRDMLIGSLL